MLQRSLLIVEDDPALAAQLEELFRLEGYAVRTAPDGLDALRLLAADATPDLMLLDMHMEGVTGWDLGAELKAQGLHVPTLVITGDRDPRQCAGQVGAAAYLAKPFELGELLSAVEELLASQRVPSRGAQTANAAPDGVAPTRAPRRELGA